MKIENSRQIFVKSKNFTKILPVGGTSRSMRGRVHRKDKQADSHDEAGGSCLQFYERGKIIYIFFF